MPQALQFGLGRAGAGAARIEELALRCVVAEQQRADPMSTALGIAPSDDDKLFPVQAFDFKPCAPVRLVSAIDALRDDALNAVFAGRPVKLRAMSDLMIVVSQAVWRTLQQRCQSVLALDQRQSGKVLAVQKQQVE